MKKSENKKFNDPHPRFTKIPKKVKDKLKPLVQTLLKKCTDVKSSPRRVDWNELSEVYELVQTICEIERPFTVSLPCRENHWEAFYEWCSKHNAKFENIRFKEIKDGNFGAVAESDIKENYPILSVPRRIMMSELTAKSSKLGPLISSDPILYHMPNVQIAMHLLMEVLNPESEWLPYISILPSSFNTVLYFTLDEIKQLQGSPVLDEVIKILYSVARQYCYFSQLFQANSYAKSLNIGHHFTYDLYRWSVSVVMSRQNFIPSPDGSGNVTSLVPLFDMCNHANGRLSTDFSLKDDMLVSYSCKTFSKGDEVCTFYGNRTNGEFFVHNAFVYPENENDGVEIKLGLGKGDLLLDLKKEVIHKLKIPSNGPFYIQKGGILNPDLLSFVEVNVMKMDELENVLNAKMDEFPIQSSPDLKRRALLFLKDRIFLLLKCYKTTLEEDKDLLKTNALETQNLTSVVLLRMCEKRILNDAYKFCVENAA